MKVARLSKLRGGKLETCPTWISRMLSEGDGTPSTKRVCFFSTTFACIIFASGLLCSKNAALAVDLMKWLLTTAGAAYGITRFAEYGGSSDAGQADK